VDQEADSLSSTLELEDTDKPWSFAGVPARHTSVFLHSGWRCGSTYIWSRFRQSPYAMCFYEPFHETLSRCTARRIRRETDSSWNSRHPQLDLPYRHEYLSLMGLRGIRGYQDNFAVARYFPSQEGIAPEQQYLRRLLTLAARAGKSAVFGFSRSLARSAAIKQALGGYHIVIQRDPLQQWLSCRSYRVKDDLPYFELCHFLILALAPPGSPAARIGQQLGLPRPPPDRFRYQYKFLRAAIWPWSDEFSYRAFLAVYTLSHAIANPQADLLIDMDRLHRDGDYGNKLRGTVFGRTGLLLNLDECRMGTHDLSQVSFDVGAVERDTARMLRQGGLAEVAARQPTT
jgi:hypothetical protein